MVEMVSNLRVSGIAAKMRFSIRRKLRNAGAVSKETAVTPDEAELSPGEIQWLKYLGGGIFSIIKKTDDGRYYT